MRFWTLPAVLAVAAAGAFAPAKPISAAEPIAFTIKFPPGQIDHQSVTMDMEQTISSDLLPTPKKQTMKMSAKTTMKTIKSDASGSTVEVTYDSVKISGSALPQAAADELDKTLAAFVGQKITLHFKPDGKADKVEGVDAILAKIPAGVGQTAIKQFLSDERIKDQFSAGIEQILPKKPVNIGDTWDTEVTHKVSAVEVKIKCQVKLVSVDEVEGHKIAKLEFTGKGSLEAAAAAGAPKFNVDQFDQTGKAEFDLTRGFITLQKLDQHMIGNVKLGAAANAPTMKIDQVVKVTSTVTSGKPDEATPESKKSAPAK
jgi:hypothetical protein